MKVKEFMNCVEGFHAFYLKNETNGEILRFVTTEEEGKIIWCKKRYGDYDVYSWYVNNNIVHINIDIPD